MENGINISLLAFLIIVSCIVSEKRLDFYLKMFDN